MSLKNLMSVKSVICLLFGIAFVLVPVQTMNLFGLRLDTDGAVVTRLLGASFVLLGIWLGLQRTVVDEEAHRAVAAAVGVGDLIGAAVMIFAGLSGVGNALGWVIAAVYLLLAIGFGYVLFAEPQGKLAI